MRCHFRTRPTAVLTIAGVFLVTSHISGGQGRTLTIAATPATIDLRDWDRRVDSMIRAGDLRLRDRHEDTLMPGRTFERFDQFVGGVRVFGGDVARQVDGGGTISLFGVLYDQLTVGTTPALSPEDARAVVSRLSGADVGGPLPELGILPLDDGRAFTTPGGTVNVDAGGAQAGGGLRVRF